MTENRTRSQKILTRRPVRFCTVLLACAVALLSGCSMQRRPAIRWATEIQAKPEIPPRLAMVKDIPEEEVPNLQLELPSFPLRVLTTHTAPPRPRVAGSSSAGGGTDAEKSEAPLIAPQLTAGETAAAQQQTNQSLIAAEKNLESARGKRLNAAQLDIVSKIKGFMKDAREAAQVTDWGRARGLAKKAQVLSEELVQSL